MIFIREREGTSMPRSFVEGHLNGAAYVYDRAAYKIYREMTNAAEVQHQKDVNIALQATIYI